jgi:hypothetical protein
MNPSPSPGSVCVLTDLDQTTIANMTAALDAVCKKIPPEKDCRELRKRIADAMIALAGARKRAFIDFQNAGLEILDEVISPGKRKWRGLFRMLSFSSAG